MFGLLVCALLVASASGGLVRVPKIYNALISSDDNLSPSHAYPIIEPVFRTTALGVAFPPIIVNPQSKNEIQKGGEDKKVDNALQQSSEPQEQQTQNKDSPQISYHGTLYPVTYDPFFPYAYRNEFLFPALPYIQSHPVYVDLKQQTGNKKQERDEVNPAVNFKKNPDIPDVPPPPLPARDKSKTR